MLYSSCKNHVLQHASQVGVKPDKKVGPVPLIRPNRLTFGRKWVQRCGLLHCFEYWEIQHQSEPGSIPGLACS
jgi:hypothetical protein